MKEKNEFCKLSKQLISDIENKLLKWEDEIRASKEQVLAMEKSSEYFDQIARENMIDLEVARASRQKKTLNEIRYALNKIKTGTYGICEESGEVIEQNRLQANPLARYSLEMQQDMENEMRMRKN